MLRYVSLDSGVRVRPEACALLPMVDLLVFDVDGVLVDVSASYPQAISEAVNFYCAHVAGLGAAPRIAPEDTALFKRAGGFNSEWDLACAACLFALWSALDPASAPPLDRFTEEIRRWGGGLAAARAVLEAWAPARVAAEVAARYDGELVARLCHEFYGGADGCEPMFGIAPRYHRGEGLYRRERPLLGPEDLADWAGHLGLYTGRNDGETEFALRLAGLGGLFPPAARVTADSPWHKPDPGGLRLLVDRFRPRAALFAGDNVDDAVAAARYGEQAGEGAPPLLFAGILGGAPGDAAEELFEELGADVIAPSARALLRALADARSAGA